ncbi:Adenosylmethionine-8-amino-7-oxononanoate aminotransferase [Magnetospirillum sp. LM-5]|uniref:adenosylmethionine--8-amino-7-oxononanoate transaminase n=1 Tax=Magnetospirillum sp. LM-5 TaxID=2681466 RepID=UPI00138368CA|nr:adenosylmethionine--8-amino-7-oxononanoate transaminase [Magnetospirillum sp. LM-5]CAA7620285.1 Adenosylmethionine-8-amino-7-oxononanoate aminotransferase [Magnetospirillum sp. LM-5]
MTTLSYDQLRALDSRHVWHPFTQAATAPPPILALGAKGATIYGADGREYLDMVSSWWVNLHGHGNPAIAAAIADQALRLEHVIFADFTHEPAARLAARICRLLPGDLERVFFSDDGSTAIEVAMKIARQYWSNQGSDRRVFVAFDGGYHGDTVGAMSAGRSSGFFGAWENMLFPVEVAPFPATWDGDDAATREAQALAVLDQIFDRNRDQIAALIIEPLIQGAAGMRMCRPEFLQAVAARAQAAGTLLIFDEVMTGFGRTGAHFACLKAGVTPDLICLSKGLTGGFLPMSLTVAREEIYQAFLGPDIAKAFLHGHSYTANPLGCAAGLASLDLLEAPDCQGRIRAIEAIHRQRLPDLMARHQHLIQPRICGTIAAFTLPGQGYGSAVSARLKKDFLENGVLMRPLGDVLYLLPPYCIEDSQLHRAWDTVDFVLSRL